MWGAIKQKKIDKISADKSAESISVAPDLVGGKRRQRVRYKDSAEEEGKSAVVEEGEFLRRDVPMSNVDVAVGVKSEA